MKKYQEQRFQAEMWETQVWLMWGLSLALWETGHTILSKVVLAWSIVALIGSLAMLKKARKNEKISPE